MTQATCGEKGLFCSYMHITVHYKSSKGSKSSWEGAETDPNGVLLTDLVSMACSISFLIASRTASTEIATPTMGCTVPINHYGNAYRFAYSPVLWTVITELHNYQMGKRHWNNAPKNVTLVYISGNDTTSLASTSNLSNIDCTWVWRRFPALSNL